MLDAKGLTSKWAAIFCHKFNVFNGLHKICSWTRVRRYDIMDDATGGKVFDDKDLGHNSKTKCKKYNNIFVSANAAGLLVLLIVSQN